MIERGPNCSVNALSLLLNARDLSKALTELDKVSEIDEEETNDGDDDDFAV